MPMGPSPPEKGQLPGSLVQAKYQPEGLRRLGEGLPSAESYPEATMA